MTADMGGGTMRSMIEQLAAISGRDLSKMIEERRATRPAKDDSPEARFAVKVALRKQRMRDTFEHTFGMASDFHPDRLPELLPAIQKWSDQQVQALLAGTHNMNPRLYMYGKTGCGKSTQGVAAMWYAGNALAEHNNGLRWQYTTHRDFNAETRSFGDDVNGAIEKYQHCDWLYFDELGGFNPTPFAQDCLARLVDFRHRKGLITMFATNLITSRGPNLLKRQQEEGIIVPVLADVLDDRLISRVTSATVIAMPEVDHRRGQQQVIR